MKTCRLKAGEDLALTFFWQTIPFTYSNVRTSRGGYRGGNCPPSPNRRPPIPEKRAPYPLLIIRYTHTHDAVQ